MGLCNKTNMHSPIDLQFTLSSNTFSSSVNYNAIPELYKYYVNVLYFSGCYKFKNKAGCFIVFQRQSIVLRTKFADNSTCLPHFAFA